MLGKRSLLVLLVLGVSLYMVAAQNNTQTEDPEEDDDDQEGGDDGTVGERGRPGPPGPSSIPQCRVQTTRRRVNRVVRYNNRNYRCYAYLNIRSCSGGCSSTFYTNPETLAPVTRCPCCKPSRQVVQTFSRVLFTCPRGVPVNRRRFTYRVPVATSCRCQGC